jgi:hypothetical protein
MPTDDYEIIEVLGKGAGGEAVKVKSTSTGELAVIKTIDLEWLDEECIEDAHAEAKLHETLVHPNIV